jgi:hypothetical protein
LTARLGSHCQPPGVHPSIWLLILHVSERRVSSIRAIEAARAQRLASGDASDDEVDAMSIDAGADPEEVKMDRIKRDSAALVSNAVNSRAWPT